MLSLISRRSRQLAFSRGHPAVSGKHPNVAAARPLKFWTTTMWYTLRHLANNHRNPYLPRAELDAFQASRLHRIIGHARATVPYYRQLLRGRTPLEKSGGREIDLGTIPITRKKDLLKLDRKMILCSSYDGRDLITVRTGGTTGIPFEISFDADLLGHRTASHYRAYIANGYKFRDKIANLQFAPVERNKNMARLGLLRKYTVPFGISLEQQIRVIQSIKPTVLEGYASRLSEVARETIRKGIRDLRPKLVVSNSEQLNSDSRSKIRKAFGVEPVNVYDSWEFGIVAWECPKHEGLHVNEDLLKVEIVKDDGTPAGPGEEGELVITDLFNKAMPLIRYGTGDIAVRKETPCTCGRTFFLLNGISGRESERCIFSDGTYAMATTALNWIISHEPQCSEIIEYQGVQNRKGELDLVLVTKEGFSKDNEKYLRNCILKSFPLKRVKVSYVNRIVRTSAGKFKPFVSNVRCP